MRRTGKRLLALILVLAVAAAILPMPALAQNEGTDSKEPLQYDDRLTKEELLQYIGASDGEITLPTDQDGSVGILEEEEDGTYHAAKVGTGEVTVDEKPYSVTVEPAELNIVLISGQSNADGVHGGGGEVVAPEFGDGYIWVNSQLSDLGKYADDQSCAKSRSVGWYPALAAEWHALTGEKTVIIHSCVSGNPISTWAGYDNGTITNITSNIVSEVKQCIQAIQKDGNFKIIRTGYYWLQGESDAYINENTENTHYPTAKMYETAYEGMHSAFVEALKVDGCPEPYGAILSCRTRTDGPYKNIEYCGMRVAQQNLANQHENIFLASVIMEDWIESGISCSYHAESGKYNLTATAQEMINSIHYNQIGYNVMGLDAADNMYEALFGQSSAVTSIELIGHDGHTKYENGATIYVEDNMRTIGTLNTCDEGKAQIVARPLPISADCSSVTMTVTNSESETVSGVVDNYGCITVSKIEEPLTLTVTANGVVNTYTLTSRTFEGESDVEVPVGESMHYKWDFTNNGSYGADDNGKVTVESVFDENTLTYSQTGTVTYSEAGMKNSSSCWFDTAKDITLKRDVPWTIEWRGAMTTGENGLLLSDNDSDYGSEAGRTTPYIYLRNGGDDGKYDLSVRPKGTGGGPTYTFSNAVNFNEVLTWKLSNDGKGNLTLSNSENYSETMSFDAKDPETYCFNAVLGRFGSDNRLCYDGTIEYLEIYTPDREDEVVTVGIEVKTAPDKIIYEAGDEFDCEGMVVVSVDSDGNEKEVKSYTVTPETLTADITEITISYTNDDGTFTAMQPVSVGSSETITGGNCYYWDFSGTGGGNTLEAENGNAWDENTLTYVGTRPTVVDDGSFTNSSGYFSTEKPIAFSENVPWAIEWKGSTTSNSVVLANNKETDVGTSKAGPYVYIFKDGNGPFSLGLREKDLDAIVTFNNIPETVRENADAVWHLSHDGNGAITLTISDGEEIYTGTISNQNANCNLEFNGVLGRFTNSPTCYYSGQIDYLKVWEEVVPERLEIKVKEGVELEMGETLHRDDLTVTVIYNDGSAIASTAASYQISSVSYADGSNIPTYTIQAIIDGQIVDGTVELDENDVSDEGYYWNFTGSITKSVGWDIPDIGSPAHIEELQEEILIVGIPVTLTAKSFDFIVDALDLPR